MIVRDLRTVPGVAQVTVVGGLERELTVQVEPSQMQAAGISVAEVVQALEAQNLAAPVGRLNGPLEERAIRLKGRLDTPADFERLVVAERDGQVVRLGQIATVRDGTEEQRDLASFNGRDAVGIEILKAKGYSTTQVTDVIHRRVAALQERMPPGVKLEVVQDAGLRVHNAVRNVREALIEGALLTVLVVFLFLNSWRSTVITGLALPVSVLASFIAVWAFGFTLNTMSLMGLSLAIGILIDDAIVVRENIVRHIEMGKDHYTAARRGHRRNRARGGGDDLLHRRGVRAGGLHVWRCGAVVQALRPHHRLLGAGVALRLLLAGPHAVGLLARPPDRGPRASQSHRPGARPVQPVVRSDGGPLPRPDRLGARPPADDDRARGRDVPRRAHDSGAGRARRGDRARRIVRGLLAPGPSVARSPERVARGGREAAGRPDDPGGDGVPAPDPAGRGTGGRGLRADQRSERDQHDGGGAPWIQPRVHQDQGRGGCQARESASGGGLCLRHSRHAPAAQDTLRGPGAGVRAPDTEVRAASAPGGAGPDPPAGDVSHRRRPDLRLHQRFRGSHQVGPDPDERRGRPGADRAGTARGRSGRGEGAGCRGRRALHQGAEARARGAAQSRTRRLARHHGRAGGAVAQAGLCRDRRRGLGGPVR